MARSFRDPPTSATHGREFQPHFDESSARQQRPRHWKKGFKPGCRKEFIRSLTQGARPITKLLCWGRIWTGVQVVFTIAAVVVLAMEGFYAASFNEKIVRSESEVEFLVEGMQTRPSAEDLKAIGHEGNLHSHTVRVVRVDGVQLHPVGSVLVEVIRKHNVRSMIDWPCREHRDIVPSALRLAMNVSSTDELAEATFRYHCMDTDSAELARSSFAVRDAVGRRRGLHYVRQKTPGLFKLSGGPATTAKSSSLHGMGALGSKTGGEAEETGFKIEKHASEPASRDINSAGKTTGGFESSLPFVAKAQSEGAADLIFSWGGREGGANSTTEVRELVLSAARSGAKLALIGAHAAYGTRWEMPDEEAAKIGRVDTGRLMGPKMPYFPFGSAILSMDGKFSPMSEIDDTRFLVLYRLDAVPKALVRPELFKKRRKRKTSGGISDNMHLSQGSEMVRAGDSEVSDFHERHERHRANLTPRERIELDIEEANHGTLWRGSE